MARAGRTKTNSDSSVILTSYESTIPEPDDEFGPFCGTRAPSLHVGRPLQRFHTIAWPLEASIPIPDPATHSFDGVDLNLAPVKDVLSTTYPSPSIAACYFTAEPSPLLLPVIKAEGVVVALAHRQSRFGGRERRSRSAPRDGRRHPPRRSHLHEYSGQFVGRRGAAHPVLVVQARPVVTHRHAHGCVHADRVQMRQGLVRGGAVHARLSGGHDQLDQSGIDNQPTTTLAGAAYRQSYGQAHDRARRHGHGREVRPATADGDPAARVPGQRLADAGAGHGRARSVLRPRCRGGRNEIRWVGPAECEVYGPCTGIGTYDQFPGHRSEISNIAVPLYRAPSF
ncbi:hypothetical protein B0H14DRAFT_3148733 [Mycena olivaceomarginata]|nr:hypothetical protein B0H14DRAFT_3148733 [Mycena olivaceomarginata]